jgi:hypothetical protein
LCLTVEPSDRSALELRAWNGCHVVAIKLSTAGRVTYLKEAKDSKTVQVIFQSSSDEVILNNAIVTLRDVVRDSALILNHGWKNSGRK